MAALRRAVLQWTSRSAKTSRVGRRFASLRGHQPASATSAVAVTSALPRSCDATTRGLALLVFTVAASSSVSAAAASRGKLDMESADAVKAEELYGDESFDRRALLKELREMEAANGEDVGVLWRLARAAYDVAGLRATPADEKKELTYYAKDVIQRALDLTQDVAAVHNWYGIILSSVGDYEGSKVAIANSYTIKGHWEKAVELNPANPTTYYLLGRWCIAIADLSWLERKAAAVLFGTPPEASYDDALRYLLQSEALTPDTWKQRSLLIAQVHLKKRDTAAAQEWLDKALALPVVSEEDENAHEEATALRRKL